VARLRGSRQDAVVDSEDAAPGPDVTFSEVPVAGVQQLLNLLVVTSLIAEDKEDEDDSEDAAPGPDVTFLKELCCSDGCLMTWDGDEPKRADLDQSTTPEPRHRNRRALNASNNSVEEATARPLLNPFVPHVDSDVLQPRILAPANNAFIA
jgi:hypothetical protein